MTSFRSRSILLFHLLLSTALLSAAAVAGQPPASGDYAGWIYFDSGPDMPVRLHIAGEPPGAVTAALDLPVYDRGGMAAAAVESSGDALHFTIPDISGFQVRMELRSQPEPDEVAGRTTWASEKSRLEGDVFLYRSAVPLPWVPPSDVPDASGVYALSPSRSIIITRRSWGELFYSDPYSGRSGYLFPQSPTSLFAGEDAYVPTAVRARVELELDGEGAVSGIVWRETDHRPTRSERTQFIIEPLRFTSGDVELVGEMTRLPSDSPRPGIVVLGGSDWDTAAGMRQFASTFASFGFAVLTFDKRGHGESGGEVDVEFATIAGDIAHAADVLAARPDVLEEKVGVFGYSRAGWHIPLAASMTDRISFALMFVPPAVTPAAQETTRRLAALLASGVSDDDDVELAREYLRRMWEFARSGEGGEAYLRLREQMEQRGWLDALEGPASLDEAEWRWGRLNMHYDPLPALRRMECPVLAVFGGADTAVPPGRNLPLMQAALGESGNVDVTLEVIPEADHGLRVTRSPDRRPGLHNSRGYAPELWPMVHAWLAERAGLGMK